MNEPVRTAERDPHGIYVLVPQYFHGIETSREASLTINGRSSSYDFVCPGTWHWAGRQISSKDGGRRSTRGGFTIIVESLPLVLHTAERGTAAVADPQPEPETGPRRQC